MARAKGLSGLNPLAYMGVEPSTPSDVLLFKRRPTVNDYSGFNIGAWWIWIEDQEVWVLVAKDSGIATWVMVYPASGGGGTSTYITDAGSANSVAGDINLVGGSNINTTGVGDIVTINLNSSITVSGSVTAGTSVNCADLTSDTIVNTTDITCGGSLTAGTGVDITAGGIDSTGTTRFRDFTAGVLQSDSVGTITSSNGTNGQVLVGGGTAPAWANITSTGGTVTITNGANSINLEQTGGVIGSDVAFMAYCSVRESYPHVFGAATEYGIGYVDPFVESFDLANAFFPGDGAGNGCKFTVPTAGIYCFRCQFTATVYGNTRRFIIKTTSETFQISVAAPIIGSYSVFPPISEVCVNVAVGDTVEFIVSTGPTYTNPPGATSILGTSSGVIQSIICGYLVD